MHIDEGVQVKIEESTQVHTDIADRFANLLRQMSQSYSPQEICQSLMIFIKGNGKKDDKEEKNLEQKNKQEKQQKKNPRRQYRIRTDRIRNAQEQSDADSQQAFPQRRNKWMKRITVQEQRVKFQEQKCVAREFCEHGVNYNSIIKQYPKMTAKSYRCYIQAVNNQNVNDIIDFLRYECSVQIQKLNRDQKRSMRTQLTKIREWLGNRDLSQLQTYYRFIHRHYNKSIQISYQDAIKLYKTIIQIIKSPYVNVLEIGEGDEEDQTTSTTDYKANDEEERAFILEYIKSRDLTKVSDSLCHFYGYQLKWSIHSLKQMLKQLLVKACKKLATCLKRVKKHDCSQFFSQARINSMMERQSSTVKGKLLSYLLEKRTNFNKVNEIVDLIKAFFKEQQGQDDYIQLPKLQISTSFVKQQNKLYQDPVIKIQVKQQQDTSTTVSIKKNQQQCRHQ